MVAEVWPTLDLPPISPELIGQAGTWKTTKGKGSYLDGIKKPLDQSIYQMILIYFKDRQL